jgi:alpha-glucosidase
VQGDLLHPLPEVDVPDIVQYARSKGVQVLLWVEWRSLDRQLEEAMSLFERWGVAGIKVDYMNRDDQEMVVLYEKWVRKAAEHHLTVDFHGAYKPTGLQRTYPNLLTREGVMGMEYNKWSERVTPEHNVTIPFTRMLAGPMDFTPGGFRNAARGQFQVRDIEPMAQGTRAHQLSMYVVYESPLVLVSDYPEAYDGQPGIEFIEKVPVVWDDTRVLQGAPGKFVAIARRHDSSWYLGAMTNWDARELTLPLNFLGAGTFEVTLFADGSAAASDGTSITVTTRRVTAADTFTLHLASGGGAAVIFSPAK